MNAPDTRLDHIRHWHCAVRKGRIVYDAGDPTGAFYRVDKGCIRLQLVSEDGRRRVLAFCLPGDIFGLELGATYSEAAVAAEDSQVSRFSTSALTEPPFDVSRVISALGAASGMISGLITNLEGLGRGSAEDRLMWFLDWLADRQNVARSGGRVCLPMNRRDIADFLGLAQETLSRTFARLEARNLVATDGGKFILMRPPRRSATAPSCSKAVVSAADASPQF